MTISEERLVESIEARFCAAVLVFVRNGVPCFQCPRSAEAKLEQWLRLQSWRMGLSFSFMEEAAGFGTPEHGWTSIFFQTANLTGLTPGGCIGS